MDQNLVKKYASLAEIEPSIWQLTLNEKVFDQSMCRAIHYQLDQLEMTSGPCCMITTSKFPKIFNAGMNLAAFKGTIDDINNRLLEYNRLNARMLQLPFPTVVAINGHCYAAGLMFAMCHDIRIMREDFGDLCLSEINLGFFFHY